MGNDAEVIEAQRSFICNVGHIDQMVVGARIDKPQGAISVALGDMEVFVALGGLIDFEAEKKRLTKQLEAARKELAGTERTLANESFVAKAAAAVIEKKRARADELSATISQLENQIADFS